MATITDRLGRFDGQVGSVVFRSGVGETDDADMLEFFAADADRWDVTDSAPVIPNPADLFATDPQE